jgi:cyclohexyl-isocyanide hydratase
VDELQVTENMTPTVAMLMYPGMTLLDLAGPQEALSQVTDVQVVATSLDEMHSDSRVPFRATTTIADVPSDVDVLFVPGGDGSVDAMRDPDILDFLANRGHRARFVTSVCTGSLVLGAAGLLVG